ncbi:YIP1 family protein [Tropicimonas sp. TH_r6]|uniref:YIP1 family protein n=1 Tax=Tropicimonas sp. TH_r6 TaxID=3082085 RepID=UPI0029552E21|nr:YIP1 family protein [Tropicimonas sp. TH_r6]MDV7144983.1 YIP1 family protein [Tropicimonas sp. TH_r6]
MTQSFPGIPALVWETLRTPRDAAARILALDLPRRNLWEALAAGVLLTVVIVVGMVLATPVDPTDPASVAMQEMYSQPIPVATGQMLSAVSTVYAIAFLGRFLGGTGTLDGALALVAWHQLFLLCVALLGMAVGVIFPPILSILLLGMIGLYFYVLTQFVCVLHGFENAIVVFIGIVIAFVTLLFVAAAVVGVVAALFLGV